ncbi:MULTISPECIES: hypothetical protein [Thermus]|uniref:hypothetical protein n=1 Tax=Thermus TaxID=270 RepID=UPI001F3A0154|nr:MULTISPECIES: hypothetical protein [Thermus]
MPLLEVLVARKEPLNEERKEAIKQEAEEIFREVLGTPPGRLRVFILEERKDQPPK